MKYKIKKKSFDFFCFYIFFFLQKNCISVGCLMTLSARLLLILINISQKNIYYICNLI